MNLIKSFLCFNGKSSGYAYVVRYLIIVFLVLLPTAIIIHPLSDISNISAEILPISYLLNYLTLWDDMFYFEVTGFFNWTFFLYLIFWNAKYDKDEERKSAKRLFKK